LAFGPRGGPVSLDTPPCDNCDDQPGTARAALERMAPGHPPLTAIERFEPDLRVLCGDVRCVAMVAIFVSTFSDATTLPIIVRCSGAIGGVCEQVDHYGRP
jgi:hypothetical protein